MRVLRGPSGGAIYCGVFRINYMPSSTLLSPVHSLIPALYMPKLEISSMKCAFNAENSAFFTEIVPLLSLYSTNLSLYMAHSSSAIPFTPDLACPFPLPPNWLQSECERLSVQNLALRMTISQLASECKQVEAKLEAGLERRKQRRNRRLAAEIPRYFQCEWCEKSYGSSAALMHHCLAKHSQS